MRPGESSTVEGVTAATRADAMLLMASQFDEHKVPTAGDALDAAGAGLLDGTRTARATHRVSEAEVMELHGMGPKALDHLRRALAARAKGSTARDAYPLDAKPRRPSRSRRRRRTGARERPGGGEEATMTRVERAGRDAAS